MSVLTCAEVRELAPEFALGILGGAERAEVVLHVNGCARCQAYVAELTEAADAIPQLVPEAEPPQGFEAGGLNRLSADRRRGRGRWVPASAAVAAAAAIISVTVVRVVEAGDETSTPAAATARPPVAVAMEGTASGVPAGWAFVDNGHKLVVSVSYGMEPGD